MFDLFLGKNKPPCKHKHIPVISQPWMKSGNQEYQSNNQPIFEFEFEYYQNSVNEQELIYICYCKSTNR